MNSDHRQTHGWFRQAQPASVGTSFSARGRRLHRSLRSLLDHRVVTACVRRTAYGSDRQASHPAVWTHAPRQPGDHRGLDELNRCARCSTTRRRGRDTGPTYAGAVSDQLVVGFDLDMTLIDTVVGFAATLDALGAELGVEFPTEEMTSKLGPPLDLMLEPHLPAEQIRAAVGPVPRDLPGDSPWSPTPAFPGVAEALAAVRRHHGRIVLVTGKYTPNAQLHVDHLGLDVDVVEGRVWGTGKGEVLAPSRGRHLRGRPRPRRRGSAGRRHPQRLGADRWLHPRGARGGRHRRRAHRPGRVPGLARRPPPGETRLARARATAEGPRAG